MVMIFESTTAGPGTHALVIGAGSYPAYPEAGPTSAARSAAMFATWMRQRFANSETPLATIDWAFDGLFQIERAQQLTDRGLKSVPPLTFDVIRKAIEDWRGRLEGQPRSKGIFFFSGRAVTIRGDTALLPPEFQPGGGKAVSLRGVDDLMGGLDADLLYLIDAGRPAGSGTVSLWHPPASSSGPRRVRRAAIYATSPDQEAGVDRNGMSLFAKALMESLEFAADHRVSKTLGARRLFELIGQHLARESQHEGIQQRAVGDVESDFIFHEASPEPTSPTDWRDLAVGPSMPGWPRPPPSIEEQPPASLSPEAESPQSNTGVERPARRGGARGASKKRGGDPPARKGTNLEARDVASGPAVVTPAGLGVERPTAEGASGGPPPDLGRVESGEMPILDEGALDGGPVVEPAGERESNTEFIPDDAETERDELGRSVLAIGLARRLHRIWRTANETPPPAGGEDERAGFVVHLDAPWGGGKTTFANYLARVLNPLPAGRGPAAFLSERYGRADLGGIFLDDPPADEAAKARLAELPADVRRPWIVVPFNAWQVEHCAPPWWVFYQTIRKGCFDAARKEGDCPWRPDEGQLRLPWLQRMDLAAKLWLREIGWRLTNPKVRALLITALIGSAALLLLLWSGAWGTTQGKDGVKAGFILTSGLGLLLAGITGVSGLWGVAAVATESIIPGTDTLAERLSLGSGDPFERFRRHFARTIARVRRPVMVVVDDLDRCRPGFVVDLVRGMQTLLRSPRVVFVILGDRDWIERAFKAHHSAMERVDVGPEQSLGARFVEKAIQMSFILPAMGDESRLAYVRRILLGAPDPASREAGGAMNVDTARAVRELANREAGAPNSNPFDTDRIVARALEHAAEASGQTETELKREVEQLVGETLAINATSSERVEQAVAHQLEALAGHFPANPRQIKRIVNAITIYYAVALQRPGLNPDAPFRIQLAIWVIIMTEWPETWRLIASFPAIVRILQADDPQAALAAGTDNLPGSPEATAEVVRRIAADTDLMALIKGGSSDPLDPDCVPVLAQLTPLHSRRRRLPEMERSADLAPPPKPRRRGATGKAAARGRAS
jgi:hypothetical protein